MSAVPFHELATATYCPRQLYYARRDDDRRVPDGVEAVRALAFAYDDLRDAPDEALAARPIEVEPDEFRRDLDRASDRFPDAWPHLVDPPERDVLVAGRDCRGYVGKVLPLDPPVPSLVSPGEPPEQGVWQQQGVRAVAAAKALSWREGRRVERAFVEYPAHGTIREVGLTTRRKAAYRTALRTVRSLDGPPPRLDDRTKCEPCDYREECGVKTRSLKSLLGL